MNNGKQKNQLSTSGPIIIHFHDYSLVKNISLAVSFQNLNFMIFNIREKKGREKNIKKNMSNRIIPNDTRN